ncbi:hypothetical protein MKW94_025985 [Papaver nudicaule]|uniref:Uncharacterized protein n=1 Tax=Papaver nudicaule TaxID=74823 RepID=A0AA41UVY9_PAPNU|nr:hypothetical protein [Papaver nudicaule]
MANSILMRPLMSSAFRTSLLIQARTLVSLTTIPSRRVSVSARDRNNGITIKLHQVLNYTPKAEGLYNFMGRKGFSNRATEVNSSGSIDSPLIQSMEIKIKEELKADVVVVKDAYGDGRHVSIDVISTAFEGQSAVNRQRMVYKAIWEELQNTVHAVDQMTTKTPTEAANR